MAENKGILVVGEIEEGELASITKELLGGARQIADSTKEEVNLLLIGEKASSLVQEAITSGADKVYLAAHPSFAEFHGEAHTFLISELCKQIQPALCLMGQTDWGRDVAPRVAARLGAGLCMDCLEVKFDSEQKRILQSRPVFGGKAIAVMASAAGMMQIDTVRPKSMTPLAPDAGRSGQSLPLPFSFDPAQQKARVVKREKLAAAGLKLEEARVIVAGGGGVGDVEGFAMLKELAQGLGGAVGATRVPVDEKWVPLSQEIGQTGKIVSPELYIAVGISGAAQHITGILGSKCIVAINKDSDANIFKVANYGVVADYRHVLPTLIEKIKSVR
ncbi:MAG: electron transfer flavoprotein subunit alpha [Deltaproteobacteria bacterium]|nr:electron transfer flavoprotein subunit alpha [Deltaproteobacteria bacterium]